MTLGEFTFTTRARPVVEIGVGDSRVDSGSAQWDQARWDDKFSTWVGSEPLWYDVTCDTQRTECSYGRAATTDRFVPGTATVLVDNSSGWADPTTTKNPNILTVRPGRAIRFGVEHAVLGTRWRFRGFIDAMRPTYLPNGNDAVELSCVDALGEVNRARLVPLAAPCPVEAGRPRVTRILDLASWPQGKRDLWASATMLLGSTLGGQVADLLGVVAESCGGAVFGNLDGDVAFRPRDWMTYNPATSPVDGTIGNVGPGDVCPSSWTRPFDRADISTRVILGRNDAGATPLLQLDDPVGAAMYGIEPWERTYLLTQTDAELRNLGERTLATRSYLTAPRVRAVTLHAASSAAALDLMSLVDVYAPSRYRCRLTAERGEVFDVEMFATGAHFEMERGLWRLDLNLDVAEPFAMASDARWDRARWSRDKWTDVAAVAAS